MSRPGGPSPAKRLARWLTRPATSPIDGRIADVNRRVASVGEAVEAQGSALRARADALQNQVAAYARAASDATSLTGLELRRLEDTFSSAQDRLTEAVEDGRYRERLREALDLTLDELDGALAHVLNRAAGHHGFAAEANLWFNPPVVVELSEGEARLATVNERIVEMPFAMGALGRLQPPARILDIGSAESTFPLSAAALGYQVHAVDLRELPYSHPNLTSFAGRFEDWPAPPEPFDAAFLISTIEHVGIGAYGEQRYGGGAAGKGADQALVERVGEMLVPGGLLVLTTPYGEERVNELERTYDDAALASLLSGWNELNRQIIVGRDDLTWAPGEQPSRDERAVAMIIASSPAA